MEEKVEEKRGSATFVSGYCTKRQFVQKDDQQPSPAKCGQVRASAYARGPPAAFHI